MKDARGRGRRYEYPLDGPSGIRGLPQPEWVPSPMARRPLDASVDLNRIEEDAMTWKLALAALAALVATAAPAAAGPSH